MEKSARKAELQGYGELMESLMKGLEESIKWLVFARICVVVGVALFAGVVAVLLWRGKFTVEMCLAVSGILLAIGGFVLAGVSHSYAFLGMKMSVALTRYAKVVGSIKGFTGCKK